MRGKPGYLQPRLPPNFLTFKWIAALEKIDRPSLWMTQMKRISSILPSTDPESPGWRHIALQCLCNHVVVQIVNDLVIRGLILIETGVSYDFVIMAFF
eukprot:m.238799 g.238799  ORF g.238799 m.238799 type:complete len:98 (-) comp17116_c2_seq18:2281-2574(-)